jgi:hypothetical protein
LKIVIKNSAVLIFILLSFFFSSAQEVRIEVTQTPLNKVLISIIDSDKVNISFDDNSLSHFLITQNNKYPTIEKALEGLLTGIPYNYELIDGVWVIYPETNTSKKKKITVTGRIFDIYTDEPLPYSHVIINGWPSISNLDGYFSVVLNKPDSTTNIKVSHLGYYILDTIVELNETHDFPLVPSSIGLSEIVIKDKLVEKSTQIGDKPGLIKLNHKIAHFLPGYGDNSVFNLIRLMPGILASGEQTSELIIWGSYAGQSKVMFDGFTVFGLKNFNDNISSFNPLIAKDIEIHKGGYDAGFGGRVGGIIDVIGKNGNINSTSFSFSVNNMTMSGIIEIPIAKKGSLILAFRHTYYDLYKPSDMSGLFKKNTDADTTNDVDITVTPKYLFRDLNIKYSTKINNDDLFYISLHGGTDKFSYIIDEVVNKREVDKNTKEEDGQLGGTIYFTHNWKQGYTSDFQFNFSSLNSFYSDDYKIRIPLNNNTVYLTDFRSNNRLGESTIKNSNNFALNQTHTIEGGVELTHNSVTLHEYSFDALIGQISSTATRSTVFVQDNISLTKSFRIVAGARITYALNLKRSFIEPRISSVINLGDNWKINAAWGIYNQFISLSSIVDDLGNYRYLWVISNNTEVPVLNATHYVLGTSFHANNFTFSVEGYYKNTSGLTRYIKSANENIQDIYYGKAESYGVDLLIKKDILKHSAWIAYSIGRTMEHFNYFKTEDMRRAPQDQLHELKLAAMMNFDPIFFSANYVFGSGFPYSNNSLQSSNTIYSRLDASIIYKFLNRVVKGEVGMSILNVLNTQNLKYSSFEKIPGNQTNSINIFTEAIPFTPTLYLKISM